jgi:predicted NBD/HSP70 family sugar kinase
MFRAGGIDLGGTKIEAQKFGHDWNIIDKRRVDTPKVYEDLVMAISGQVAWLCNEQDNLPVGIAAAGLSDPKSGNWIAANLSADGKPFVNDVANVTGTEINWLNDCRAFTQAEAIFGSGCTKGIMVGLVLGTGIAGGVAIDGTLINLGEGQSGEFGHLPISASVLARHGLPALQCGCGRIGCYETYGSGPGMQRLAQHLFGRDLSTRDIIEAREKPKIEPVWNIWIEINATLIYSIIAVLDPTTIVLGGGMSQVPGLVHSLRGSLKDIAWEAFPLPTIEVGARGETAAALGAAYSAWHAGNHV